MLTVGHDLPVHTCARVDVEVLALAARLDESAGRVLDLLCPIGSIRVATDHSVTSQLQLLELTLAANSL